MLQTLEIEILHHADKLAVINVATHKASHMELWKHLHECLIGNDAAGFILVVRLTEVTAFHNLKPEELRKVDIDGQHFHKNLIAVIPGTAPTHFLVGDNLTVSESHSFNRRVLKQMALQGIFLVPGRISAPGLKNARLIKAHVPSYHKPGLNAYEQGH